MVYNRGMIEHYTIEAKPKFHYGDMVEVDMAHLGNDLGILKGKIVGRGSEHIIDFWLIEFEETFGPTYPFKVVSVPHVAIVKR